jgi:pimeloyl-ACP methyl ester carboxylesterase
MTTYVLVHGAWGGSFSWKEFAPLLRERGHEVVTPSLTGLGEREHLSSPQVTLSTHIHDVVNAIDFEGLHDIILVGHSYGGMVVTGVVDRMSDRIAHIVYEDAFLPKDGESLSDLGGGANFRERLEDGWKIPGGDIPVNTPEEMERARKRRPMPIGTFEEKIHLSRPIESYSFTRTYIKAGGPPGANGRTGPFWTPADYTRANPAWRYYEFPCGHGIHRELPYSMLGVLLELATRE